MYEILQTAVKLSIKVNCWVWEKRDNKKINEKPLSQLLQEVLVR